MDSYNIHFEKMSNFDLHPVSHSPSKYSSSIDQYTHHHGKGDSAYSSFSGGSTAPDYPSPFSADDLHTQNLHYADLKYVKAVYGPSILDSDSKGMSHLYRSMEAISHQHHHSHNECSHVKDPPVPITHLPPPPPPPPPFTPPPPPPSPPPPPPPDYLDSFITAKTPETSVMSQSPEGQFTGVSSFRHQTFKSEIFGSKHDLVYDLWVPQNYERKQDLVKKTPEVKLEAGFTRSPLQTWQPEHLQQNMEKQSGHSRTHSACGVSVAEQQHTINSWHMTQNTITGSIQHKGQFYFVTGVYKSCEPGAPPPPQCPIDDIETHTPAEIQRSHNTVEDMFKNVPLRKQSSGEIFFQEKKISTPYGDEEPSGSHHFSKPQNAAELEDMNMDVGRYHTRNHPIFYCGPEDSFSTSSQHKPVTSALSELNQNIHLKQEEPVNKLTRQPLADVPTEKISKEMTPLLYHLTGASRANVMKSVKKDRNSTVDCKESDWSKDHQEAGQESGSHGGHSEHSSEAAKEEKSKEFYYLCSTMDDSFKKYYKEKLKDAQSKVLRETSFKRKDLRFSWKKMIEQCCDKRLSVVPSGPPSQENPNPAHLPTLQNTDTLNNTNHEMEKEMAKQQNIAQPQVPRVGCRKRLTLEQKKLSNSEPGKLHRLGEGPTHVTCRSLGSESEGLLSENHLDHGLVAVRRKMFEVRERAMSACSFSKSSLKHFQQKALVAYMERKTGCKVTEPQQASPQVSTAWRHSDWGSKPYSLSKEKPLQPMSASYVHDAGSIRHAQFSAAQHGGHSRQSSWREQPSPPSEKSVSVEDLLEARERSYSHRSFSTSSSQVSIVYYVSNVHVQIQGGTMKKSLNVRIH